MKFNNYKIEKNKPLASFTWFNVGGMSKYYFQPRNVESLENYLKNSSINNYIYPLGAGSNILIRDKGYDGLIIHFNKLNNILLETDGTISADCGATDAEVARFARNNNRSGDPTFPLPSKSAIQSFDTVSSNSHDPSSAVASSL